MNNLKRILFSTAIISLSSTFALAHTPYLAPLSFEPARGDRVSLDASFADKFFVPDVAFNNSIYHVVKPDGKRVSPDLKNQLHTRVVVEHTLSDEGTYRFSTGRRYGRIFKTYELDGERHAMPDHTQPIPDGARLLSFFQSLTMAETYVTKGAPNKSALAPYNEGLEFVAQSHPNELFAGESVSFQSLFAGAPLAGLQVSVYRAENQFTSEQAAIELTSDENGMFSFTPQHQGNYLVMARHRTDAPEGSPAPQISNTYTLVFEVVE